METSSENMNTENNETLSFPEKRERDGRSQYTLNGIVISLTESLGRVIGIVTRESQRLLSKVRRDIVSEAKEFGKKAGSDKTKASKDRVEDYFVDSTDKALDSRDKKEDAIKEDAKETQNDENEPKEKKESQDTSYSKQDASEETQATKTSAKGQRRKSKDEDPASGGGEENSSSDEEK
jgi:hypothetical protein